MGTAASAAVEEPGTRVRGEVVELLEKTERYCVVLQTLRSPPEVPAELHRA